MSASDIEKKVKQVIADNLGVAEDTVRPASGIVEDLGADSLAVVELVLALEEAFEIDIPDEETERIKTVQDVVDYVVANVQRA